MDCENNFLMLALLHSTKINSNIFVFIKLKIIQGMKKILTFILTISILSSIFTRYPKTKHWRKPKVTFSIIYDYLRQNSVTMKA